MVTPTPPPGSDAAYRMGCTCPRMDNRHGRGAYVDRQTGEPVYWYTSGCPLHDGEEGKELEDRMIGQDDQVTTHDT